MSSRTQFGTSSTYRPGTDHSCRVPLAASSVDAPKPSYASENQISLGGYEAFEEDVVAYDTLEVSEEPRTTEAPQRTAHRWGSKPVPIASSASGEDHGVPAGFLTGMSDRPVMFERTLKNRHRRVAGQVVGSGPMVALHTALDEIPPSTTSSPTSAGQGNRLCAMTARQ